METDMHKETKNGNRKAQNKAVRKKLFHDVQYWKFSMYGFLKNLRFFDPYLILFFHQQGISYLQIGLLFSIREIVTNILEIPSGIIADTFGRRRSMMLCFASYIVSFIVFAFFSSFYAFAGAMAVFAVGEAFRTGTHKAMIIEYLRINKLSEHKVTYYGHTRAWSQRGSALSALIAGFIVFYSGSYQAVFLYTIIPYVLGLFLMMSYPSYLDFSSDDADADGSAALSNDSSSESESGLSDKKEHRPLAETLKTLRQHTMGLIALFRDPAARRGMLNFSLFDSVFKSIKDYIQPIIRQFALAAPVLLFLSGEERSSVIVAIVYFLLYLISAAASKRSDRISKLYPEEESGLNMTFAAAVVLMAGIGVSLLFSQSGIAVILFILYYSLQNIRRPMAVGYLSGLVKNSMMATGLSGESQFKSLMTALLAPLFGWCVDSWGLGTAVLLFTGIMLLTAVGCRLKTGKK